MDPYSYVAPSRVRTFVCPLGKIKRNVFMQYTDRLNKAREVRLLDVTPDPRPDRSTFSPQGYPNGKVVYDFSLAPIDQQICSLFDLEPWRQTLVVMALTCYKDNQDMDYEAQTKKLRKQYPGAICYKVLVFGAPDADAVTQSKNVLPVLSTKVHSTSIETVMCDITTDFLAELGVLTISKQLGSFNSPGIKELDTPVAAARPGDKPYNVSLRRGMVKHSPSASSVSLSKAQPVSKSGSISIGPTERSKSKQRGRVLKYTGNMYLLAGHLPDALKNLSEAASMLKDAYDHLWFGSALDTIGVCLVLQSFLEVPAPIPAVALNAAQSYDTTSVNVSQSPGLHEFLPNLTSAVVRYYGRSQSSTEESVPQMVYCEAMLRFTKFLVTTRLGGGVNAAVLSAVVRGTPIDKHITNESTSTSEIAAWCNKVFASDLSNLPIIAQCNIYSGIASAYSSIGLMRKRTFILRELLVNLVPKIIKSRRQKQQLEQENVTTPDTGAYVTLLDGVHEKGILELLDTLCQVFGAGDITAPGCGWIQLKVSFLKTCISVCESIPDIEGVVYYTSLLLSTSADLLTREEQTGYYQNILQSLDMSRQLGRGDIAAKYWDPHLVRDIRVIPASSVNPVQQMPQKEDEAGVFLYNPYRKSGDQATQQVLVQNERAEFVIKLQNPFAFEVQVSELKLITQGGDLDASATNVYLPASSMFELTLPAVPLTVGQLEILGCRAQMAGCSSADYYLRDRANRVEDDKIKQTGVSSGKRTKQLIDESEARRKLEIKVVPAQPIMAVKNMSINRGWLMLLEGEKHEFTLTLSNIADVPVNLIQFQFSDSTIEPLQLAMNNKENPANEVYECEYFLYNRRALVWENPDQVQVAPHHTGVFNIKVNGKRGMTGAMINIDYSNEDKSSTTVWTRRLPVPISVTVTSSIELGGVDIIPLQAAFKHNQDDTSLSKFMSTLEISGLLQYCVLVCDFRNAWNQPMVVKLWSYVEDGGRLVEVEETLYPGRIKRFLLPVKWTPLSIDKTLEPIPLKSRRQYVVEQGSKEMSRFVREAFWMREKLLSLIEGSWAVKDPPQRTGKVELRGIRLNQKMVNVLRLEQVQMSMRLIDAENLNETTWGAPCNEPLCVATTITNKHSEAISGMLRIVPSNRYEGSDEINRKILYNGALQRPVFDIPANGSVEVKLGLVFIARGEYEWSSIFETSTRGPQRLQQHAQRQPMYVKVT